MQDAEAEASDKATGVAADGGFEFDYSGAKPAEDEESSDSETESAAVAPAFQRKGVGRAPAKAAGSDDELDIDNI